MVLMEATGLTQEYDKRQVLKGIDLKIEEGDVFALIGPTGAGKTTLLRLLGLLETPTFGKVRFDGLDVTCFPRQRLHARRRMSFVQQKPIVFTMSVYDNVACGLKWRRDRKEHIRDKVESVLELVGLSEFKTRNAKTLSGGETQRVAIARALVTDPELLLLDEPTANLDPITLARIEETLERIISEQKTTIVMATHDMLQGQRLARTIGVLTDGELLQVGSPGTVFWSPKNAEVAQFVGMENILAGVIVAEDDGLVSVDVEGNMIQAMSDKAVGDKVCVLVRPEDVTFGLVREVTSARNALTGSISRMASIGPLVRIELDCGFPLIGLVTRKSAQELEFTIGKQLYASFKATAVHVIAG